VLLTVSCSPCTPPCCIPVSIEGQKFVIFTNHRPLVGAIGRLSDPKLDRQRRHLSFIAEFAADIRHIAGETNIVADTLSRPACSTLGVDRPSYADVVRRPPYGGQSVASGSSLGWQQPLLRHPLLHHIGRRKVFPWGSQKVGQCRVWSRHLRRSSSRRRRTCWRWQRRSRAVQTARKGGHRLPFASCGWMLGQSHCWFTALPACCSLGCHYKEL
jgi:hypothetical protein